MKKTILFSVSFFAMALSLLATPNPKAVAIPTLKPVRTEAKKAVVIIGTVKAKTPTSEATSAAAKSK